MVSRVGFPLSGFLEKKSAKKYSSQKDFLSFYKKKIQFQTCLKKKKWKGKEFKEKKNFIGNKFFV